MNFTGEAAPADVLILGATVAGLVAAIELAKSGSRVEVLDPGAVTRAGLGIASGVEQRIIEIESRHGSAAVRDYMAAVAAGRDYISALAPAAQLELLDLKTYTLVYDPARTADLARVTATLELGGGVGQPVEGELLPGVAEAIAYPEQVVVDPTKHREALIAAALAAGVTISRPVTVTRFIPGVTWVVRAVTESGERELRAEHVVDTIGVSPWSWNAFTVLRYAPIVTAEVSKPLDALYLPLDVPAAVIRPDRGRIVAIGHPVGTEHETSAAAELIGWLREHLDAKPVQLRVQPVERSVDFMPLVGAVPLLSGAWVARGFGIWETTGATAAGLQIAAGIERGERMPWSPARLPANPMPAFERLSRRLGTPGE